MLAAAPDLRGRVHFVGLVEESRLARLYADAHVFLLPSLAEGFGFVPLEAMARGVPTAVSTSGSLPEVTDDGALHFDPHDAPALADLIHRMSDDAELRQRLARDGKRVAERYRWSTTASAVWEEVRRAFEG
jgi:glycosyltransferase involved in cell wall biosynthesis